MFTPQTHRASVDMMCVSRSLCLISEAKRSEAKRVAVSAFIAELSELKVLVNFEILSSSKVEVSHVFIVVIKCTL